MFKLYEGEFRDDYKAKLKDQSGRTSQVFEDIVSWCINSRIDKLQDVLNDKNDSIYKNIIFSSEKDVYSGYNIREIVAFTGKVEVMKLIHEDQPPTGPTKHLYLGKALKIAILKENTRMVQCILGRNYPKIKNILDYLESAIDPQRIEIFKAIVSYIRRNNEEYSNYGKYINYGNVFVKALEGERLDLVKVLIEHGANPNDHFGIQKSSPLFLAMKKGNYEIVDYLIENGARKITFGVDYVESFNLELMALTKMLTEQEKKNLENVIRCLISKVEDYRDQKLDCHKPLKEVFEKNRLPLMKKLLLQSYSRKNIDITFPLHNAIQMENFDYAEFLVNNGAGLYVYDKKGQLPIDYLKQKDISPSNEILKLNVVNLLKLISSKMKAQLEKVNDKENLTVCGYHPENLKMVGIYYFSRLVTNCVNGNIDEFDEQRYQNSSSLEMMDLYTGFRPIDFAAYHGQTELVKRLLKLGAKVEKSINSKVSAIDVAHSRGHQDVVNCLFEHGIDANNKLCLAVEKDNLAVAKYILTLPHIKDILIV